MEKRDYYEVLGVGRDAAGQAIKSAYRKMALKYHPDRNRGDAKAEQRFKEISGAYDILKDEQKRAAYNQFGHAAFDGAPQRAGTGGFADIFDEMFGDFMGGQRSGGGAGGHRHAGCRHTVRPGSHPGRRPR